MQVPDANIVTFEPETVHIDVVRLEKVGLRPDVAVADTENAVGEYVRPARAPNEMVWFALEIVKDLVTDEAALYEELPP